MHFLPDIYVQCDVCKGKRYNRETLEVLFKGKSIADVLDMTVEDAVEFFKAVPSIRTKMEMLAEVGLTYIKVGQSATTLSGGEAQRVKLAKELSKRATGKTVYILDEPTTGLHFHDVAKLLEVLHRLTDQGNTVIVIEHNLEVIKTADWIIDIGPKADRAADVLWPRAPPKRSLRATKATPADTCGNSFELIGPRWRSLRALRAPQPSRAQPTHLGPCPPPTGRGANIPSQSKGRCPSRPQGR